MGKAILKPAAIARETRDPNGPMVVRGGRQLRKSMIIEIDDTIRWNGPEHELIRDYAAQELCNLRSDPLAIIPQPMPHPAGSLQEEV